MNIAETRKKCKTLVAKIPRDAFIVAVLVIVSSASFGLGYLAGLDAMASETDCTFRSLAGEATGKYLASKSGTKYYLPECAGAERISEANKVWFASAVAAQAAGYTPAVNCNGI